MQNAIQNLGWKKLSAILIVLSILAIIFVVISTMNNVNSPVKNSNPQQKSSENSKSNSNSQANSQKQLIDYKDQNNTYSISFPSYWQTNARPVVGGGTNTKFSIKNGDIVPVLFIESDPISTSSVSLVDLASNINYYKFGINSVVFHGKSGLTFAGITPGKFTSDVTHKASSVYKAYYVLSSADNKKLFIISYEYLLDENEAQSKNLIQKLLDSLKFE